MSSTSSVYLILGVQFHSILWRVVTKVSEMWRWTAVQAVLLLRRRETEVALNQSEVTERQ